MLLCIFWGGWCFNESNDKMRKENEKIIYKDEAEVVVFQFYFFLIFFFIVVKINKENDNRQCLKINNDGG